MTSGSGNAPYGAWIGAWLAVGVLASSACTVEERGFADGGPIGVGPSGMGSAETGEPEDDEDDAAAQEGGDDTGSDPTDDPPDDDAGDSDDPPDDPTTGGDDSAGDDAGSTGEPPPMGLPDVGSLVILGDSLGDGGGQGPYYYDLLRDSLAGHYGPIEYANRAEGGSKTGALTGQASGLPGQMPGPVVVVISSGGNDMKDQLPAVVTGLDAPLLANVSANIDEALDELLAPGRFGAGVEVHVFELNIYDSSDGEGNFGQHDCNFAGGLPAIPSDVFFDRWNDNIRETVEARGQTALDMHGFFYGHGFNNPPNWYASDCTHPNTTGHDQLHRFVYEHVTGQVL